MAAAIAALEDAGFEIVPVEVPEVVELVRVICATESVAAFGHDGFNAAQDTMDPLTMARTAPGLDVLAEHYTRVLVRHHALCRIFRQRVRDLDGGITPPTSRVAPPVAEIINLEAGLALEARLGLNTPPVSIFGLCATPPPINTLRLTLPVGLQIVCAEGKDAKALAIARTLEDLFGDPPRLRLNGFL